MCVMHALWCSFIAVVGLYFVIYGLFKVYLIKACEIE